MSELSWLDGYVHPLSVIRPAAVETCGLILGCVGDYYHSQLFALHRGGKWQAAASARLVEVGRGLIARPDNDFWSPSSGTTPAETALLLRKAGECRLAEGVEARLLAYRRSLGNRASTWQLLAAGDFRQGCDVARDVISSTRHGRPPASHYDNYSQLQEMCGDHLGALASAGRAVELRRAETGYWERDQLATIARLTLRSSQNSAGALESLVKAGTGFWDDFEAPSPFKLAALLLSHLAGDISNCRRLIGVNRTGFPRGPISWEDGVYGTSKSVCPGGA